MKKVGILTFQNANNYGAVFQAYGLQKTIEKLNYEAHMINYDAPKMMLKRVQTKNFNDFIHKYLNLTDEYSDKSQIDSSYYDCIISGSDQVWNPRLTFNDTTYFLDFVDSNVKKISYAASIGLNKELFMDCKDVFDRYIPRFDAVSLREDTHVPYIKSIVDKNTPVISSIDPSQLLKADEYRKCGYASEKIDKDYIFVFSYALDPKMFDYANMISLKTGYKIIAISLYDEYYYVNGTKVMTEIEPTKWLSLIDNAKLVITDSYHGMMFSIVFNKPFYVYTPNRVNVIRILDALKLFGLEDRKLTNLSGVRDVTFELDYSKTNEILEIERNKSIEYLKAQIEK